MWQKILDEFPKALIGLLIPLAKFLWTRYRETDVAHKRKILRTRIADLTQQRETLSKVAAVADVTALLLETDNELQAAISQLATSGVSFVPRTQAQRPVLVRWLLAYTPSGGLAWVIHSLFYMNLAFVGLGLLGLLGSWSDPDLIYGLFGCVILLIPAFFLRYVALRLDAKSRRNGSASPSGSAGSTMRILPLGLFCLSIFGLIALWVGAAVDENDEISLATLQENLLLAVLSSGFVLLFAFSTLGWARSPRSGPKCPLGIIRKVFFIFVPSRPIGWFAHLSWYVGWIAFLLGAIELFVNSEGLLVFLVFLLFFCAYLVSAWKWAQSFRPVLADQQLASPELGHMQDPSLSRAIK